MTPSNQERAVRCQRALAAYYDDEAYTNLVDFLADAMHWCDTNDENFAYALAVACTHYIAELNGEQTAERRMPHD